MGAAAGTGVGNARGVAGRQTTAVAQGRSPADDRDLARGGCGQVRRQPHVGGREALVQAGVQHRGRGHWRERRTAALTAPAPARPPR